MCAVSTPVDVVYVLAVGPLLQRLPLPNHTTYTSLSNLYAICGLHLHYNHTVVVGYSMTVDVARLLKTRQVRDVQAETT